MRAAGEEALEAGLVRKVQGTLITKAVLPAAAKEAAGRSER